MEKQCPLDKPVCIEQCAWYMDGSRCAVVVMAEAMGKVVKNSGSPVGRKSKQ